MDCQEAAKHLDLFLDKELSTDVLKELEVHLKKCKDCYGHVEFNQSLKKVLKKIILNGKFPGDIRALIEKSFKDEE